MGWGLLHPSICPSVLGLLRLVPAGAMHLKSLGGPRPSPLHSGLIVQLVLVQALLRALD